MNPFAFTILNPKLISGFAVILTFLLSCNSKQVNNSIVPSEKQKSQQVFSLTEPQQDLLTTSGRKITIKLKPSSKDIVPDSAYIYIGGDLVLAQKDPSLTFIVEAKPKKVGKQNIRVVIYYSDSLIQNLNSRAIVVSEIVPVKYRFKLLKTIPHDETSYTQGLIYSNYKIYEGTGRNNNSKLRKIDPENGVILKETKLEDEFFGEGITLMNNKIYQLTYRSKVGLIYDVESFEVIRKFDLQTIEGWGLTNDSKNLISSDGSSNLYFYDPEYLTQVNQLDVCNNKRPVTNLNELEYIDGFVWANIYGEPYIVKIDARSGAVIGTLDLESLFPKDIPRDIDHVLNGIAYNNDSKTFFITGKLWPVIHEINIIE
jgi:glutaminyl-peptide cyclotransferase